MIRTILPAVFLATAVTTAAAQVAIPPLARQAQAVFEKHCHACHGEGGTSEGGMNFVLNRDRLVSSGMVHPGKSRDSDLWKRMLLGEMPPDQDLNGRAINVRPTDEEIQIVKDWIDGGAQDFLPPAPERKFISNTDIVEFIHKDVQKSAERSQRFLRYFTITHLYNTGLSEDELASYRAGLSKLVNSLSWGRQVVVPQPIDPAKTVFRIDLRDYRWRESTWERILEHNPYGLTFDTREARDCYDRTRTEQPFIRADWFVFIASRPPLYHDILEVPANARDLEKQLHIDIAEEIRTETVARAGFNSSGVSRNNRLLERHDSPYGAYWVSYDFAGNVGRKNLFEHPLGPGDSDKFFEHDGGEIIFNLPNGLQGYLLVDGKGNRIDKGPIDIVSDPKQKDRTVVNGVSCMSCHARGMISATDQIRPFVEKNRTAFPRSEADTIFALYPTKAFLDDLLKEDTERFRKAVETTGAAFTQTEPVFALAGQFEQELNLSRTAAEAGVTPRELLSGLDRSPVLGRIFGALRVDGGTIQREVLVEHFGDLASELHPGATHCPSSTSGVSDPDYDLGLKNFEGRGDRVDEREARAAFERAAERGHVVAKAWLANDSWNGLLGSPVDKDQAIRLYREVLPDLQRLAERGVPDAQNQYGFIIWDGIGVPQDERVGYEWLRKSADQGFAVSQFDVAVCFAEGRGVPQDDAEAVKWYRKAAEQNLAAAQNSLGNMYANGRGVPKDDAEAVKWFRKAAEQGDATSQHDLGFMYANGRGIRKDDAEAVSWFRRAAVQNNALSQFDLGFMYANGRGIRQDDDEAASWFRKAAEQDLAIAQNWLGFMYIEGRGTPKDRDLAAYWIRKAAKGSDESAAESARDLLRKHGLAE